jgi:protein-disulfide reductase (glutathione)
MSLALALGAVTACVPPPDRGEANAKATASASTPDPAAPKRTATIPADGWNDRIAWRGLDEGLAEAKSSGMPVMMVVHTSWCGNCQKLKRTFNSDLSLEQLSEQFVMVHVDQDAQPEVTLYGPDGQYIPRVLFLDEDGNVDQRLQNPNRPSKHRFFYTPQEDLVATMRQALDRHGHKS